MKLSLPESTNKEASQMAQQIKNLLAMQETLETWVQPPSQEDLLEKEIATHPSILEKIPCTEESGRLQSMRSQRVRQD